MVVIKNNKILFRATIVVFCLLFIGVLLILQTAGRDGDWLQVEHSYSLALREISAMTVFGDRLLAVGDSSAQLVVFGLRGRELTVDRRIDLTSTLAENFSWCPHSFSRACRTVAKILYRQWEGIYFHADSDEIFLLQENTARVLVFSGDLRLSRQLMLNFFPDDNPKRDHDNSLGEGLVVSGSDHLLVAKEKFPASVIEFAPQGEAAHGYRRYSPVQQRASKQTLVPVHSWRLPVRGCDLSDLVIDRLQVLYGLSQSCRQIYRFAPLAIDVDQLTITATWNIPSRSAKNPEALVVIDEGLFLVASDEKQHGNNLILASYQL